MIEGVVVSVNTSQAKGTPKTPVDSALLDVDHGIAGDAHAGPGHRQVSLLSRDAVERMRAAGATVSYGSFAENLTIDGLDPSALPVGTRLRLGTSAVIRVTQLGKECHDRCEIYAQVGECVMPREGVFGHVEAGGAVSPGDEVCVVREDGTT
jgi:MOSC domain-containing protein YiiM